MAEERRTVRVPVLMTPTEHAVLVRMARDQGRSRGSIMCRLLVAAAQKEGMWVEETEEASDE